MQILRRLMLIATTLACCIGCDQASKAVIRSHVSVGEQYSYFNDTLRLTHAENPGAFLSIGERLPERIRTLLFSIAAFVISSTAVIAAFTIRQISSVQLLGLAFIAAGGFGNWIDRVTNNGLVTDFLNVGVGGLRTGIFNIADMALMLGLCLLALQFHYSSRDSGSSKTGLPD